MLNYLPWIEKYRPLSFDNIISNEKNLTILQNMLLGGSLPHLLFSGISGTGKTSTINVLVKSLYGNNSNLMVMKLDASDDRGINSVREEIKGFAEKKNMFQQGIKLIILDEADSMTFDAQFALRRIIEKYSRSVRFCLICNYENKIIPAIKSRCVNLRFYPIKKEHIIQVLNNISIQEQLTIEDNALEVIAELSNGDLRKAINLLQSIAMYNTIITPNNCYETTGLPTHNEIMLISNYLNNSSLSFIEILDKITRIIKNNGYSLDIIIKEITLQILDNKFNNKPYLLSELSDLETKISKSNFIDIYISAFVSIFIKYNIK